MSGRERRAEGGRREGGGREEGEREGGRGGEGGREEGRKGGKETHLVPDSRPPDCQGADTCEALCTYP